MKEISIQALKGHLSGAVADAEAGETILITRRRAPVARLGPVGDQHVTRGAKVGTGPLRPAIKRGSNGRYLAVLSEDRGNG
ncbi:MAG: type II toxin-antitoxin system Phd/YefM family antitoxin [Acidobacteria bacterium]|nr:type II toxin-antitoxin system Phd/YefM family antitoxin [Acidobacteriota bacterium]